MQLACPRCGTRDTRVSRPQGLAQYLKGFVGISVLRCRRCSARWETSVWAQGSWKYARCPRCYRQELTKWATHHYSASSWTRLLLKLGASPRRCEACRFNFASFRPRKEPFSRRHEIRAQSVPRTMSRSAAMVAEQTPPGEESGEQMP